MTQPPPGLELPSSITQPKLAGARADLRSIPGFLTSKELNAQPARLSWLCQGYLAAGNVTLLTSQWKSGKTTLVAVLLAKMAKGGQLAGLQVKPGKAVVVSEESSLNWYQ